MTMMMVTMLVVVMLMVAVRIIVERLPVVMRQSLMTMVMAVAVMVELVVTMRLTMMIAMVMMNKTMVMVVVTMMTTAMLSALGAVENTLHTTVAAAVRHTVQQTLPSIQQEASLHSVAGSIARKCWIEACYPLLHAFVIHAPRLIMLVVLHLFWLEADRAASAAPAALTMLAELVAASFAEVTFWILQSSSQHRVSRSHWSPLCDQLRTYVGWKPKEM